MNQSRKQREIANRHALFLEIAEGILADEGFHLLSMDRIAEVAEYSKGTVYQHFTCKEEILIQLCIKCMTELHSLFQKAAQFDGSQRDRVIGFFYAHQLWSAIGSNRTDMLMHLSMHGVREKVTERSLHQHDELEQNLVGMVSRIVQQAIEAGELPKHKHMQPAEIVFGMWSLSSGGQMLQSSDLPLEEFGVANADMTLLRTLNTMLDGLNWQPLHNESQFKKLLKKFNSELFADEYKQATENGNYISDV